MRVRSVLLALALAAAPARAQQAAGPIAGPPAPPAAVPTGRIAGTVLDAAAGKPLIQARVQVLGREGSFLTDLDGRFRTAPLPAGTYGVRVSAIGYTAVQVDSVRVKAGETATISAALKSAPVQIGEFVVQAAPEVQKASSDAGLLAAQQNSPAVTDGISAETISRTPDSDAGAAVTRVTGISVLDNKVVVRGLSERYSSTVLNGIEVASPEPDKKFVPLEIFPASLLEALVAQKTATPDRPGDFSGGSVDIETKEFPDSRVVTLKLGTSGNSQSAFKRFPLPPRGGTDWLGIDDGRRDTPPPTPDAKRFSEGFSNSWTPAAAYAWPNASAEFTVGDRLDLGGDVLGFVASATYGRRRDYNPARLDAIGSGGYTFRDASVGVDWGGILNLAYRLGTRNKFAFKNFYTRTAEDLATQGGGTPIDPADAVFTLYQRRYVERYVYQGVVSGEHRIGFLANARLEWRYAYGRAGRADLDNRQLTYIDLAGGLGSQLSDRNPSFRYNNRFTDKTWAGNVDLSIPLSLREPGDAGLKFGVSERIKRRDLQTDAFQLIVGNAPLAIRQLPPEQALAPENLGAAQDGLIEIRRVGGVVFPYKGRELVQAGYGLIDADILPRLRFLGGARFERWNSNVDVTVDVQAPVPFKQQSDLLLSANLTYALSDRANLRAAAYQTVARPDLRELSPGGYPPVVGGLFEFGNPGLQRGTVNNGDMRFELYPGAGELLAVSGFVKEFTAPIVNVVALQGGDFNSLPINARSASSRGLEFESRVGLGRLAKGLGSLSLSANLTLIKSRVTLPDSVGASSPNLRFQGQSPYLVNLGLTWAPASARIVASILYNRFGNRVFRYGALIGTSQGPSFIEVGRGTIDAKVKVGLWSGLELSLAGRNLTNPFVDFRADFGNNRLPARRTRNGVGWSLGLTYAP